MGGRFSRSGGVSTRHPTSVEDDQVTPTAGTYILSGGKQLAATLENLAAIIPVPFISEFVKVAITVIEACEDATAIEENAKRLQKRVYTLTLAIIESVPAGGSSSSELQSKIEGLQSILNSIMENLNEIKQQKKWLLVFFRDVNKERVDQCVERVNAALEQFHVAHEIRAEDLLNRIKLHFSDAAAQLDRIEQAVKNANQPHSAPANLPRQDMPLKHQVFYGRESFVEDIASLLSSEETSRVCITGPGGMGKTSTALAVVESAVINDIFPKKYQFWVPCVEAKSADLLRRILYIQLRITADSYDTLDPLIKELDASKERRVLLLDNFETPWFSGDANRAQVQDILCRLAKLSHIALLVTMTSASPPSADIEWQQRELPSLDPSAARDAFKSVYRDAADEKLDELLRVIGHIPLAITLMAADGKRSRASPKDLLEEWGKAGTDMISRMDRTISLSVNREVVTSNPAALTLLAVLSMLPAGTTVDNLRWWAPSLTSRTAAIESLRTAALIEQEDSTEFGTSRIFVRSTVQSYMAQQDRIPEKVRQQVHDACYRFVLEHKSIPDDSKFKADLEALASEETNIQGLLMQIDAQSLHQNALDALITFSLYQFSTKPSAVVALHALEVARAARDDPHVADRRVAARHVAEAQHCLGEIYLRIDRYDEACQYFEDARCGFKNLPGGADCLHAGESSMKLVKIWMYEEETIDKVRELVLEAQGDLSYDEGQKYYVARGLLGLGDYCWWSETIDEALGLLSTAKAIFEELDCPASTAECLVIIARVYACQGYYSAALPIARQALAKADQAGERTLIGWSLRSIARHLIVLAFHNTPGIHDEEVFDILERSLSNSRVQGTPLAIAQTLELLAFSCAARMDLQGARVVYEGARGHYTNMGSAIMGKDGVARCSCNLEKLEGLEVIALTELYEPMLF
ncbi:hypothetical protein C8R44DRAFT_729640 [Mycena epipterygia]|nr:hypothetical protein C8R44DRAFT_729640 [Mycena epipterygia]